MWRGHERRLISPHRMAPLRICLSDAFDAARKAAEHVTPKANRRAATPDTILPRASNDSTSHLPQPSSPVSPTRPDLPKRSPHRASRSEGAIKALQDISPPRSSSDSLEHSSPKMIPSSVNGRERMDSITSPLHANGVLPDEAPSQELLDMRRPSLSKQDTSSDFGDTQTKRSYPRCYRARCGPYQDRQEFRCGYYCSFGAESRPSNGEQWEAGWRECACFIFVKEY